MSKKPDDAARVSSLASILSSANKQTEAPPSPALPPEPPAETPAPAPKPGRAKIGKYRDPSFHHYGVYLRKTTHKQAKRRLEDTQPDKDISELMEELLQKWLTSE